MCSQGWPPGKRLPAPGRGSSLGAAALLLGLVCGLGQRQPLHRPAAARPCGLGSLRAGGEPLGGDLAQM